MELFEHFVTDCVSAQGDDITLMQAVAIPISYRTFASRLGPAAIKQIRQRLGYSKNGNGLALTKDWAVGFHRSTYRGVRCYYMQHSRIEYVYTDKAGCKQLEENDHA